MKTYEDMFISSVDSIALDTLTHKDEFKSFLAFNSKLDAYPSIMVMGADIKSTGEDVTNELKKWKIVLKREKAIIYACCFIGIADKICDKESFPAVCVYCERPDIGYKKMRITPFVEKSGDIIFADHIEEEPVADKFIFEGLLL